MTTFCIKKDKGKAIIHDELYENIKLLCEVYPPSEDFKNVFTKNMFVKSNSVAFEKVSYYLFYVLNATLTKEMITTYPVLDAAMQVQFRKEVMNYVSQINVLYPHGTIPQLLLSNFISPGGLKFALFMFKLSKLVIYEHLRRVNSDFCPIDTSNIADNDIIIDITRRRTQRLHADMVENRAKLEKSREEMKEKLKVLSDQKQMVEEDISKLAELRLKFPAEYKLQDSSDLLTQIEQLTEKLSCFQQLPEIEELLTYILRSDFVLKYDSSLSKVDKLETDKKLDLCKLLEASQKILPIVHNLQQLTVSELTSVDTKVSEFITQIEVLKRAVVSNHEELKSLIDEFHNNFP